MSQAPMDDLLTEDSFFSEMMSSQSNLEDQVLLLKEALNTDRSIEDKVNELHNFLSNNSISNVPIDILNDKVLNTALVGAKAIYFQVIQNINELSKSKNDQNTDIIKNELKILLNILKCWDLCINQIKDLEKVSVTDIKTFPETLMEIMVNAINHCKISAQIYEDYCEVFKTQLTTLFGQCVNTLNAFYSLLDTVISFDTNQEEEMNILLKIIDETGKLASLTSGMDAKTLTDMWKRFGKLSSNYNLEMKKLSSHTVTYHFKGLSENIVSVLISINHKNQRSSNERSILCCRVLLKILEKLCETYYGWIRSDAMVGIIVMLIHLFDYTEQKLKINGFNADFIKFIVSNLSFMIEPFLTVILKNDSFKTGMSDYNKLVNVNAINYHLLLLMILKKMSTLPYEIQQEWYKKEFSIFDACFQNLNKLSNEICLGKLQIQMSRDIAQGSYMANIYEATCINMFALICQMKNSEVSELILTLLKYLLSGNFFSSLISCDVWCFISRLGSSEECYTQFKYLMQIYETVENRKNDINVIMLANLIQRQYTFLMDKDKYDFFNNIGKLSSPQCWSLIGRIINAEKKKQLQLQIDVSSVNARIASNLSKLEEQPSMNNLNALIKDLSILEACDAPQNEQSSAVFIKMWNKIVNILGDCEGPSLYLLETLACSILRATNFQEGQTKYSASVLQSIIALYPYASSNLRLEFCQFLRRCTPYMTDSDSGFISELFCRLLIDEEPCVQQQALESFEFWTRACPNPDLLSAVAVAIKKTQSEASRILPAYISSELIHEFGGVNGIDNYFAILRRLDERNHVCRKIIRIDKQEKLIKLDDDVQISKNESDYAEKLAEKVCEDIEKLFNYKDRLNISTCEKLQLTCKKFLNTYK